MANLLRGLGTQFIPYRRRLRKAACAVTPLQDLAASICDQHRLLAEDGDLALYEAAPARHVEPHRGWHRELSRGDGRGPLPEAFATENGFVTEPIRFLRVDGLEVNTHWGVAVKLPATIVAETARAAEYRLGSVGELPGFRRGPSGVAYKPQGPDYATIVDEPCLHAGHRYCDVYGHWFSDFMTSAWAARTWIGSGEMRLLMPAGMPPWAFDVLAAIGIGRDRILVPRKRRVRLKHGIVGSTIGMGCVVRPPLALRDLGRDIAARLATSTGGREKLLFITREGDVRHSERCLVNEEALAARLLPFGFQIVRPGRLSFSEQVNLFAQARLIVSPHGSALMNLIFAPAGCGVVDLMPWVWKNKATLLWAHRLTNILQQRYAVIMAGPAEPGGRDEVGRTLRYAVDVDAVVDAVQAFLD